MLLHFSGFVSRQVRKEVRRPQDRDPATGPTCLVSPNDLASGLIIHILRLTIGGDGFACKSRCTNVRVLVIIRVFV